MTTRRPCKRECHRVNPDEPRGPAEVRSMFDRIARRYDLLNHLLSANLDHAWRRRAAAELAGAPAGEVLDLCGGTGDMSLAVARRSEVERVICCDFSHEMLRRAEVKFRRRRPGSKCVTLEADGLRLPFPDERFGAVTVAFGVRNFDDRVRALREIGRVLRPGGRLVVLEFSRPAGPWLGPVYRLYLKRVLPRLGGGIAGASGPYRYLAQTIAAFPDPPELAGRIRDAGFAACGWTTLSGGIVAVHTAIKGGPRA
ncbi:MAG TPA: bifunctional demethylmenaquinone methyltransferase/2-methoxy-6-polyprenyl-1,4-benzoquinol methylase UbiE [Candidatus Polarisedimenticolaceae bacterium]|nr:bifunctional demethylmenaquinone methyltransferase/2-methoxy-6-polyprenyl-1,4-benzoquinol methylase UbiE [Candidatus Polarisedimenticolaceae bacterium]